MQLYTCANNQSTCSLHMCLLPMSCMQKKQSTADHANLCYNYATEIGRHALIFFVLQLLVLVAFSAVPEPFCQLLLHVPPWLRV